MSFIIGIDVGGTNTDVAIVEDCNVIGWNKSLTTTDIIGGVLNSIKLAVKNGEENGHLSIFSNIKRVNIGTTQFINAVINRRGLEKVACVRLCGVTSHSLPPFCDFPDDLRDQVDGGSHLLNGGFEFNSKVITELKEDEVRENLMKIVAKGIHHVAVSGNDLLILFSHMCTCRHILTRKLNHTYSQPYTHTHACAYSCMHIRSHVHMLTLKSMFTPYTHAHRLTCMHAHTHMLTCTNMHRHVCIRMHMHGQMLTRL